ncbi:MAG: putative cupin superfamily protein [Saprospiraceae bacterium]|jgi:uncharacterized cupin superfamily protein
MTDKTVIKFNANDAMDQWEAMPQDELTSAVPVQKGKEYFSEHNGNLTMGLWECTPFEAKLDGYPVDEFMHILEGSVTIIDESGKQRTYSAGENFVIPKGHNCIWKQTETIKKFYVIFEEASHVDNSAYRSSSLRIDSNMPLIAMGGLSTSGFEGDIPEMAIGSAYKDVTSQFEVGVWDCNQMKRVPSAINRSELMIILEGHGSIINGDGISFDFTAGDVFAVPVGMGYQWVSEVYVKKVFCSLTPNA